MESLARILRRKTRVADVALMEVVQLEMKSKLKHGLDLKNSHPVLAGVGNMVWECPIHSTT